MAPSNPAPSPNSSPNSPSGKTTQRIDKWLWYARLFKSRSLAAKFVETGKIRIKSNGKRDKLQKAAQIVHVGDVLTFAQGERIRVFKIVAPGTRRGPAAEAQTLYLDLSPAMPTKEERAIAPTTAPSRPKGEGRPTKRDRRALDKLQDPEE